MSLADLAATATAIAVAVAVVQLRMTRRQARTTFEDALAREYRELALQLPAAAFFDLVDPKRPPHPFDDCLSDYLRYIDLSNTQVFLRKQRRVSRSTWLDWCEGMRDNLDRAEFDRAWQYIQEHVHTSFNELAALDGRWDEDPGWWDPRGICSLGSACVGFRAKPNAGSLRRSAHQPRPS